MVPTDLRYTNDHEWVRVAGDEATIGITAYAADQLGDIVFVELPDAGRTVKLGKAGDFVGRAALERVARDGPARRLVGLVVEGRGIARHGYPVFAADRRTGVVTSGTQSPTLGLPIAMAYVAPTDAEPGTVVDIEIREARIPARVVTLPFYRRDS